jgi:hypothetical protein
MAADCPAGYTCSPYGSPAEMLCIPPDVSSCQTHDDCVFTVNATGGVAACVTPTGTPPGRCLNTCRTAADCPADYSCQSFPFGTSSIDLCIPPATGNGTLGESCTADANCRSNLCLASYCTDRCGVTHAGQFCPYDYGAHVGFGCLPMTVGGSEKLVCVPTLGTGATGASCSDQSNCRSALCLTDNNNQTYCTKFCNDGLCQTGYSCADVGQTVDGVALRACAHP